MAQSDKIVLENQKQGTPQSEWDLSGPGSKDIEGFASEFSVNVDETVEFKIDTVATDYRIEIYRLGYYGGDGARLVETINHQGANPPQPEPLRDNDTNLVDAGNWQVTDTWDMPADIVSGVYIAKLVRQDGVGGENHIPFVVRDDSSQSDIVFQTSDTTWQAYNTWGQNDLYDGVSEAVSYNRPMTTREGGSAAGPWSYLFGAEYSAIRWLEANGYDVSYMAGVDTARNGDFLLNHSAFLSVGHDEYWSAEQRENVEAARDAGVHLAFWSGNEVFWKTRWETSIDGSGTPFKTMISYKETLGGDDPSDIWTGTWRDPAGLAEGGGIPENALTGTAFKVNNPGSNAGITITYEQSQLRFWDNTAIANLEEGQVYTLPSNYLAYEFDEVLDNGFRPEGLITLSSTTTPVEQYLIDNGGSYAPGTATHSLTLYRADSGALVFGAGTVFWPWALDATHDAGPNGATAPADINVQQATVNLFAEMGIQPLSLQAGLVAGSASTDFTNPVSGFVGLNDSIAPGYAFTISGTATDLGGGVVAGVEVSTDGGLTWHPATGTSNWTYVDPSQLNGPGTVSFSWRAIDDNLNVEATQSISADVVGLFGYLAANPDVAEAGWNARAHYDQHGWLEGRDPLASFDTELYLLNNPDVLESGFNPLAHYLQLGQAEGRTAFPAVSADIQDGVDYGYYLLANPDVALAGFDPLTHYELYGADEGRNPNAFFNTIEYKQQYTDVVEAGFNPLTHYLEYGWQEGRDFSPNFDTQAYLADHPDVAAAGVDPLQHYLFNGIFEGRSVLDDGVMA